MKDAIRVMPRWRVHTLLLGIAGFVAGSAVPVSAMAADCKPVEARKPNAADQRASVPGQTRACEIRSTSTYEVELVARGLVKPWAVEPLPDGNLLVTEKSGKLRLVEANGQIGKPIAGVLPVDDRGQGGLLDVALSPRFEADRMIYWSFSEPRQGGNATSVAKGVLSDDWRALKDVKVIFRAQPTYDGDKHYGSRLAFGSDGMLYVTLGERSDTSMRPQAQDLESHMGKVLRIRPDGSAPPDNPFVGKGLAEIWTLGHRNVQGSAFDAEGRLWVVEHGTRGGDELNLITRGQNYGWPLVAYGVEYSGRPIAGAKANREGYTQPVYYWDPVIAPSGAQFYTGSAFPEWKGNLFVGGLKDKFLVRLVIKDDRVTGEEHLLANKGQRVRDVRQGMDGALYVVTDESNGSLWKIRPRR